MDDERAPVAPDAGAPAVSGPAESCNDVVDDLDGRIDETCPCVRHERRACDPTPPPGTELCAPGVRRCAEGSWGVCEGATFCRVVEERFTYTDAMEVVVVVDQSESMYERIDPVRDNLARLASAFHESDRPSRLVVLASRSGEHAICVPPPLAGPDCGDAERFHQIDREVGSWNALELLTMHLDELDALTGPDSQRVVLVVSDDDSGNNPIDFHAEIRARPGWADYRFYGVVGMPGSRCDVARWAVAYPTLARTTGGDVLDVCAPDWASTFGAIVEDVAARPRRYPLSHPPFGDPEVFAGDPPLPLDAEFWRYDAARRAVVIEGGRGLPPGTVLLVRYRIVV